MKKTLILGLGGAGTIMVNSAALQELGCVFAINTDNESLKKSPLPNKLLIGSSICNGKAALNPTQARLAAESSKVSLEELFTSEINHLVLLAGLGGATGTGVIHVLSEIAKSKNIPVLASVTIPSKMEGIRRDIALQTVTQLETGNVKVVVYDHEDASEFGDIGMLELMAKADQSVCNEVVRELKVAI